MNQSLFDEYFDSLSQSINSLPLPIALVDNQLNLVWANQYLRKNYPYLTAVDSITTLLEGYNISSIIQRLQLSTLSTNYPCKIPILSSALDFSPILDKPGQLVGAIVHISILGQDPTLPLDEQGANKMLSSFSNALRSPLSSIFSSISNMNGRLDLGDIPACELLLVEINKNSYRLLKGFTSITEYSRYLNGISFLRLKSIDLRIFLEDILNASRSILRTAGKNGVQLSFSIPEEPIELYCDPDKLVIVLMSLLANSATFCDNEKQDGNHIHVSVSANQNYVKITVTDHGIGIPDDIQPHIFQPYFSYGKDAYLFSSIGLGLPLSRMIVAHHMGTLAVHSEEDVGTTVAFTISRSLHSSIDENFSFSFSDSSSTYLRNKFSSLFIFLSDICECPEP